MPDWSYRTLFRPLLFRLPAEKARRLTLRIFGGLGRLPLGAFVIKTFGHVELPPSLRHTIAGSTVASPVGLAGEIDPAGLAHRALSQIGFGYIEIGPVTVKGGGPPLAIGRDDATESLLYAGAADDGERIERIAARYGESPPRPGTAPYWFRLRASSAGSAAEAAAELAHMVSRLRDGAAVFVIDVLRPEHGAERSAARLAAAEQALRAPNPAGLPPAPLLLRIPLDYPAADLARLHELGVLQRWDGWATGEGAPTAEGWKVGREDLAPTLDLLRRLRSLEGGAQGRSMTIVASGGIHEPQDALDALAAGADLVQLHAGFVYEGPGLPKRIDEAILYERMDKEEARRPASFWRTWGWMAFLGIGMMIGGFIAYLLASGPILLPYDESFLGVSASDIEAFHPSLLHFMSHDRTTLAGTMVSIGVLYYMLAAHGLRHDLHWARTALAASGVVGFASFFLYLGYGYFDPLHGLAAAALLPMFVLAMRGRGERTLVHPPNVRSDRAWRLAQWGQLMFVALGIAFAVGGAVISLVGITGVFVRTDLAYLGLTPEEMRAFNARLIPLIAHDRAGFGGALFSDAIALLATALWGIREGDSWVWRMLLLGGLPGFAAAFGVHGAIGYTTFVHLLPAYAALLLYVAGLVLLYPYLVSKNFERPAPPPSQTEAAPRDVG